MGLLCRSRFLQQLMKGEIILDIERVNDYTLKFFITYKDIERRGFDREEIWYNRERGEELFWEMMDEAHYQESFSLDGPLWIQVQALEKGLEIIVTRAQLSQDGSKLELPISNDKHLDIPLNDSFDNILEEEQESSESDDDTEDETSQEVDELSFLIAFNDFEDVISLSHSINRDNMETTLYHYNDKYYVHVLFSDDLSDVDIDNSLGHILEYGFETKLSIHMIEEYGKVVLENDALTVIREQFEMR